METCPPVCSSFGLDVSWPVPRPPLVLDPLCYPCQGEVLCMQNQGLQFPKLTIFTKTSETEA